VATTIAALTLSAGLAAAQPVIFDQFTEPNSSLTGSEGGRGFQWPWETPNSFLPSMVVAPAGLAYRDLTNGIDLATLTRIFHTKIIASKSAKAHVLIG